MSGFRPDGLHGGISTCRDDVKGEIGMATTSKASQATWRRKTVRVMAVATIGLVAVSCGDDDDDGGSAATGATTGETAGGTAGTAAESSSGEGGELNVAIVGNPQMEDISKLTPDLFTAETGIDVNYSVLEEGTLREVVTRDVGASGEQFDVVMIGMYEAPQFGANGWLLDLTPYAEADTAYQFDDIIPTVRNGLSVEGHMYAAPFYAESSFLMYRKDVLEAAGQTMPDNPTWDQVAEIARAVKTDDMAGICLRGKPGWGDLGASFTTVLNTFGGTWWLANEDGSVGAAQVDQPEFKEALQFYVDLINDAGETDAANASYNECSAQYLDGKVAMWYDATVAAGSLEADDSPVKGLNGYAMAPVKETDASGWLWSWALAIPQNSSDPDTAWKYISWATGPDYIKEAGPLIPGGWAAIPPGTRASTYEIPEYQQAAAAFADATLTSMENAPIDNPGTTPRPGVPGVQYVGIPQFQDVGNRCTEQFSSVIAGRTDIDSALSACQDIASQVGG
jgi:polyol transport system substrate-binding protein